MDEQLRWYASEIKLRDQVVLDAGANVGELSQFFWNAGEGTNSVISIEPLSQNIKRIQEKIDRSGASNWYIERCAVSGKPGSLTLKTFHSDRYGWNSVVDESGDDPRLDSSQIVVPAKTLDQIAASATVIKLDIEGHEYDVLDQALDSMSQVHTWAVELHMKPGRPLGEVIEQFIDHGFRVAAAGQRAGTAGTEWASIEVSPQLQWEQIPVAGYQDDGSEFKMLHVIASSQRQEVFR